MTETRRFRGKWTALVAGLALLAGCRLDRERWDDEIHFEMRYSPKEDKAKVSCYRPREETCLAYIQRLRFVTDEHAAVQWHTTQRSPLLETVEATLRRQMPPGAH